MMIERRGGGNMARRHPVEQDELFETANRLQLEGREVTALTLLDALGGGSLRTIYKHLELWQQSKPLVTAALPEELPASVQAAFASTWRVAVQEARSEIQTIKEKSAEEVSAALRQFHGAVDAIGKLEKDREDDAEILEGLQKQLAELKMESTKAEAEAAAEKARADELREQLRLHQLDRDSALKESAELRGQLEAIKNQNQELLNRLADGGKNK
ncbi:MAG: hypothetical protein C0473_03580 [Cyanobacteria bacterium DS3.002]|jgi:hypothetical protein|nr:hypothetical protein [Cyanobacteria bacterium DS3.002]